ncbi:hypothetical protein MHU86_4336 [Fragilaria crotonensis]|nr:hypothetical protein MHU86_4336 [Fragilaria crotonensis]
MKWNGPQLDNQNSQNISVGMVLQPDDEVETNIVARPSDGSSRISFVEELDTLEVSKSELQYDNNDNNGNHDNGNREELDQNEGEFPDERKEWMEARQSHASFDVILTEDEVDRIFDDVFATPDEKERQVTLSEIALTRSIRGHDIEDEVEEEMPLNGKSRRFRFVTYQKEMLGCLLLALIALAAWGVGRVQSNMDSYNEDTTGTHVVTLISPQNDSSLGFILAHKINRTSRSSQPPFDVNVDGIIRGNAKNSSDMTGEPALFETKEEVSELSTIPGKDIGEYCLDLCHNQ